MKPLKIRKIKINQIKLRPFSYILAVSIIISALWVLYAAGNWAEGRFLLFYLSVVLFATMFRFRPSLLATIVAVVGVFVLYLYPMDVHIRLQSAVLISTTALIIWFYLRGENTERILSQREEELRRTFDATTAGIACVDPNTFLYTQSNEAYSRLLGYEPAEIIGRNLMTFTHPDDIEMTKNYFRALVQKEIKEFRGRKRYIRKDGRELWVEVVVNLVEGKEGQPDLISAVIQDISARKKLEDELTIKRQDLGIAQAVAQIGSWRMDIPLLQLSWSDETYRLFGIQPGTPMTQQGFYSCVHPDDVSFMKHIWTKALKDGSFDERHRIIVRGQVRWVRERGKIEFDKLGKPLFCIGTVQDITDTVRSEEAIEKARAEAEQANLAKDRFLAIVSHELRTPLTTMQLWAQMMAADKVGPDKMQFALRAIEQNVKSQAQLIDDLLDVSRIISGKLALKKTDVDMNKVIEEAIESVEGLANMKGIEFTLELDPSIEMISGDPARLKQIIWNLLSNSIKYSAENSKVLIRSKSLEDACQIQVIDYGRGINPAMLPRVFDRFVQADSSSTRSQGGLGLGLSIVRDLVKLHDGSVTAFSGGEGSGATFTVTLPTVRRPEQFAKYAVKRATAADNRPDLKGRRILVVDDSADTREVVVVALKMMGAEVVSAECVPEALRLFGGQQFDVIISDISMPGEDGYSLIRKIRSLYGFKIPAIALTAFASDADAQQALEAGFQMHLPKPVDWLALGVAVADLARKNLPLQQIPGA